MDLDHVAHVIGLQPPAQRRRRDGTIHDVPASAGPGSLRRGPNSDSRSSRLRGALSVHRPERSAPHRYRLADGVSASSTSWPISVTSLRWGGVSRPGRRDQRAALAGMLGRGRCGVDRRFARLGRVGSGRRHGTSLLPGSPPWGGKERIVDTPAPVCSSPRTGQTRVLAIPTSAYTPVDHGSVEPTS